MQLEFVESGSDLLCRPPPSEAKTEVPQHSGRDLAGQGRQPDQLERGDSQEHIGHGSHDSEGESTANSSKEKPGKHGNEEKGCRHFNEIDPAGNGDKAYQENQDQT